MLHTAYLIDSQQKNTERKEKQFERGLITKSHLSRFSICIYIPAPSYASFLLPFALFNHVYCLPISPFLKSVLIFDFCIHVSEFYINNGIVHVHKLKAHIELAILIYILLGYQLKLDRGLARDKFKIRWLQQYLKLTTRSRATRLN